MEKEKHTSLLNHVNVVTANGHVVDLNETVAGYIQCSVGVTLTFIVVIESALYLFTRCHHRLQYRPSSPACKLYQSRKCQPFVFFTSLH